MEEGTGLSILLLDDRIAWGRRHAITRGRGVKKLLKRDARTPPAEADAGEACADSGRGDDPLEDHGDIVRRPGLEIDRCDGDQLPALVAELVELGGGVGIEAVVLTPDIDDLVLPLGLAARSFP